MLRFIKALFVTLLLSFYFSYCATILYQMFVVHRALIVGSKNFGQVNLGIISLIIIGCLPMMMWKLAANSEIPLLKETWGFRLLLSWMAAIFTACLFISKSVFNGVAKQMSSFDNNFVLSATGRIVLIEILSIGVPFVLFLYGSKKIYERLLSKTDE